MFKLNICDITFVKWKSGRRDTVLLNTRNSSPFVICKGGRRQKSGLVLLLLQLWGFKCCPQSWASEYLGLFGKAWEVWRCWKGVTGVGLCKFKDLRHFKFGLCFLLAV